MMFHYRPCKYRFRVAQLVTYRELEHFLRYLNINEEMRRNISSQKCHWAGNIARRIIDAISQLSSPAEKILADPSGYYVQGYLIVIDCTEVC